MTNSAQSQGITSRFLRVYTSQEECAVPNDDVLTSNEFELLARHKLIDPWGYKQYSARCSSCHGKMFIVPRT